MGFFSRLWPFGKKEPTEIRYTQQEAINYLTTKSKWFARNKSNIKGDFSRTFLSILHLNSRNHPTFTAAELDQHASEAMRHVNVNYRRVVRQHHSQTHLSHLAGQFVPRNKKIQSMIRNYSAFLSSGKLNSRQIIGSKEKIILQINQLKRILVRAIRRNTGFNASEMAAQLRTLQREFVRWDSILIRVNAAALACSRQRGDPSARAGLLQAFRLLGDRINRYGAQFGSVERVQQEIQHRQRRREDQHLLPGDRSTARRLDARRTGGSAA